MRSPKREADGFTYADYLTWPDDERWEMIEGRAYAMTPSPTTAHQRVFSKLHHLLFSYFEGKRCELLAPPLDVRLAEGNTPDEAAETVVQPDLMVVCDPGKSTTKAYAARRTS